MIERSYTGLSVFDSLEKRFEYLQLRSQVGATTFSSERYLNQRFYASLEWKRARRIVIDRDGGCDLGIPDFPIHGRPIIHHMNPITIRDIDTGNPDILNPEYLILVCHQTHNAIHYGDISLLPRPLVERTPGDTTLWRD